jgi:hypothetical protein
MRQLAGQPIEICLLIWSLSAGLQNALSSIVESTEGLPLAVTDHVRAAASELRRIALRHLEAQR